MRHELVLSAKGQVTLPKELRERLGLLPGDAVVWTIIDQGVIITPKSIDFNDLRGFLGAPPNGPASLEDIDRTIAEAGGRQAAQPRGDERENAA
ncbi:MAG: AbrB/MazE/SpoVT family DNA-binding domain-containing protein [Rhizobiaceae bacterium]